MKHIVGFSGGADSQAVSLWCRESFPPEDVILLNTNAGRNEHPVTEWYIQEYSVAVHPVIVIPALVKDLGDVGSKDPEIAKRRAEFSEDDELTFDRLAYIKGLFPGSQRQFCTEYLKLAPQKRWINENVRGKYDFRRYVGVRRDESRKRSQCPDETWDREFRCITLYPIASWTKEKVFQYLRDAGEDVNPLYRMGFARVGCAPCVNARKDDIRNWAARYPAVFDKIREWEKSVGKPFFPSTTVPGRDEAFIDDVVSWSKTARGGKQLALPFAEAEADSGACVSKYRGVCE